MGLFPPSHFPSLQLSAQGQLSEEGRDGDCTTEDHMYAQRRPWHKATGGSRRDEVA